MAIDIDSKPLKYRRTKIVATVGPASRDPACIRRLVDAGVDVFRLNMSHGSHDLHRRAYEELRAAATAAGRPIAILVDLSGPKIRVGKFPKGAIDIVEGESLVVTVRPVDGGPGIIPSGYPALHQDVRPGSRLLLDDGNLELAVASIADSEIHCTVVRGGTLSDNKGMNLPNVTVSAPSLTEKDRDDARFALDLGVDFLALSFVRRKADVLELRELIQAHGSNTAIIAKIEKPEALHDIDGIVEAADGLMVARGDLGVELAPELVPVAQDQLIDLARQQAKPVIVATQMLESMIHNPRPTRAEVSDVANAVRSGADAVMLSAETATGRYPLEAVEMMDVIARRTEARQWQQGAFGAFTRNDQTQRPLSFEDALARSTAQLSRDLLVRAIAVLSRHGRSPAVMSASRPSAPIVALFADPRASRVASLLWGTIPLTVTDGELDSPRDLACRAVADLDLAAKGDALLIVRGFAVDPEHNQPSVTICTL